MIEFKLPSLGSDMDSGKLLSWQIQPGDKVKRGQVVVVVDTSKAAVDVESWQEGTVFELLAQPGDIIPVGAVLATFLQDGESAETAQHRELKRPSAPAGVPLPAAAVPQSARPEEGRRRISPAARKLAQERGVDLAGITGTGPDHAVTLQDVQRVTEIVKSEAAAGADRQAEMRKAIAAAMSRSKREIPHYYLGESMPMRRTQAWLLEANRQRDIGTRLLMAVLQLKAVAVTLKDYPALNGFFIDGAHRPSDAVHVGVAISLRQGGLIAPALHEVERKSLDQLMSELADLVQRARAGSLRSSEMSDPTVTVTNLGDQGVDAVYGVIYPPQVAIVGFGRIHERPWAEDGALRVLPAVIATLAADHRVSDGHYGARFLAALRERLQQPETL